MKISYDPTVDALTIRFVEEGVVECEVIHLNDQVAVDIGPRGALSRLRCWMPVS